MDKSTRNTCTAPELVEVARNIATTVLHGGATVTYDRSDRTLVTFDGVDLAQGLQSECLHRGIGTLEVLRSRSAGAFRITVQVNVDGAIVRTELLAQRARRERRANLRNVMVGA